jgi:L-2-hydroxyglutarate oxidase LhgO
VDRIDCTVIGAGVIGLAVARALALAGREVLVIEAADGIGTETSSRNSEVIHAGIYYPKGGLKARLCVEGRERLYAYAAERSIGHERIGKLIVATSEDQLSKLNQIEAAAAACGVHDLVLLDKAAARRAEPELACVAALHSPSTGIIDSHALMLSFEGDAEARGAVFAFETKIKRGELTPEGIVLHAATTDGKITSSCRTASSTRQASAPRTLPPTSQDSPSGIFPHSLSRAAAISRSRASRPSPGSSIRCRSMAGSASI